MKKALSFIFLIHGSCVFGQINLVENYSFESSVGTLECYYGPTANFPNSVTHDQEDLEDYWAELPPWTVPKMGLGNIGAGSSDHFCDGGNTGDN